ncbi:MAG: hypothetical protein IPM48_02265 [Saprospiraceae bacterium]|nr:hypothetical protein [Saprospiraceae bacterium]
MRSAFTSIVLIVFFAGSMLNVQAQMSFQTSFEKDTLQTTTYEDCILFYQKLEIHFYQLHVINIGESDTEEPLRLVVIDRDGLVDPSEIRKKGRGLVLMNHGIHPGEPEGIDAGMMLARDLLIHPEMNRFLDSVSVLMIPVYNIGGSKLRNSLTRVNQNGPKEYGFRGNRNYLDLNRDFIKADAENTKSFQKMFVHWEPDVYIETHTTNGADYPYRLTLLGSQKDKLSAPVAEFMYKDFFPHLYRSMELEGDPVCRYVNTDSSPRNGLNGFMDSPRYSSGYTTLFHTASFLIETHMLKHYKPRVQSTYRLLKHGLEYLYAHKHKLLLARQSAFEIDFQAKKFCLKYQASKNQTDSILWSGYDTVMVHYPELGLSLHRYDPMKSYTIKLPWKDRFECAGEVDIPSYYLLPRAYRAVAENLKRNGVRLDTLKRDSLVEAWYYKIEKTKPSNSPYEGHFLHQEVHTIKIKSSFPYFKGDYIISTKQKSLRYLMTALEPGSTDSYFVWNYFDGILQRKEYFSDYLFAPLAEKLLTEDEILRANYQKKLRDDPEFGKSDARRLQWIYQQSKYAEPYYLIYPVARIE